jgi:anhydro-N-acetylmuramic acid kinase
MGELWVVGLMSGTSADGIDAALVRWPDDHRVRPFELAAFLETPFEPELQQRIHRLAAGELPGAELLEEYAALDVELGARFALAARAVVKAAGVPVASIAAVASHGQTVGHFPGRRASLQIGDPSVLAEQCGWRVVADFRARDLAAGGEGAPLVPFFHFAVFASPTESRAALNLGGIANLSWLPAGGSPDRVIAFDVGPANALIDGVVSFATAGAERFDRDGARARRGRVDEALLAELLDDAFLRRSPPKSTGRERYGLREARALWERWRSQSRPVDDLIATLVRFTAEAVAMAARDFLRDSASASGTELARLLVGGGGAANPASMEALARALPGVIVEPFDAAGVPHRAAEAMAFSLMGRNHLLGLPNHLPQCTGAKRATVLGEVTPGITA